MTQNTSTPKHCTPEAAITLHAAIEQLMAAVEEEQAAMVATKAAFADHQRHLMQASTSGSGTTASLASNLPTTLASMGGALSRAVFYVSLMQGHCLCGGCTSGCSMSTCCSCSLPLCFGAQGSNGAVTLTASKIDHS